MSLQKPLNRRDVLEFVFTPGSDSELSDLESSDSKSGEVNINVEPISAKGSIRIHNEHTYFGQRVHMDPYCLTKTDDVNIKFLPKMRYLG